jgi:hypothetical protein
MERMRPAFTRGCKPGLPLCDVSRAPRYAAARHDETLSRRGEGRRVDEEKNESEATRLGRGGECGAAREGTKGGRKALAAQSAERSG